MARRHPAHRTGLVRCPQGLSDCSGAMSMGVVPLLRDSEFRKLGDVFDSGALTRSRMTKRISRGDSAHRVGRVRYPPGLSDCSGSISMGVIPLLRDSEFRKLGTFLLVVSQPGVVSPNGWVQALMSPTQTAWCRAMSVCLPMRRKRLLCVNWRRATGAFWRI